ncbi:hypothetical protein HPB51_013040 [Rhipicephalus microplus]|uniref:Uncharacterized protein n=1 Tax=Rhipicephalus microplus TaxID=6941 RepID=A0A9J6F215_RHIMP|nr:hypothetical protein HPB51_013040 [Rhipicephalus microplus]
MKRCTRALSLRVIWARRDSAPGAVFWRTTYPALHGLPYAECGVTAELWLLCGPMHSSEVVTYAVLTPEGGNVMIPCVFQKQRQSSQHSATDGCKGPYSPTFSSAAYLYPCTIEFSIILAGVWFIVWQNIGNVHLHSKSHHLEQKIDGPEGNHEITYESNVVISADCHAANKGLFSGILVLLTSIITVIIFFVVLQGSNFKTVGGTIYNCQEGILTALGLLASIVAYFKVIQLDQNAHPVTFLDNFLLFIPLPFFFIHAILCIMAELHLSDTFRIVLRVVALVQIIIQTPVLVDGLRRCSNSHVLRYRKPGREIITFLLILNVTQWVVFTVQQKHIDDLIAAKLVYGNLWSFIGHATIPLMLFYRFHSAVCLADIWQAAYHKGE